MTETLRPRLHFTPEKNWMNDPNGLIWHDGIYHLFFQHNPHGDRHGNMSWGHATSRDLLSWEQQPIALMHDDANDVFSGSVVWDEYNTSGLGDDNVRGPLVAVFTAASRDGLHQSQHVAHSTDGGSTWTRYAGNPVLDLGTDDFRDPKVFRYSDNTGQWWVMVAVEARSRRVILHRSEDLLHWTFLSRFGPAGSIEGFWECPDLFPLAVDGNDDDVRWVMLVSVASGSVAGGSGTQYFVGTFDGTTFTPDRVTPAINEPGPEFAALDWLDRGRDCYAGVTYNGLTDNDRVFIAWMSNWDYAQEFPSAPSRGSMTIPRRLELSTLSGEPVLVQTPILPAGVTLVEMTDRNLSNEKVEMASLPTAAVMDTELAASAGDVVQWTLSDADNATFKMTFDAGTGRLDIDRSNAGSFHPSFPSRQTSSFSSVDGGLTVRMVCDATSVETFIGSGETVLSNQVVLRQPWSLTIQAVDGGPVVQRLRVADLDPEQREGQ